MTLIRPYMPMDSYDEMYWKLDEPAGSTIIKNYGSLGSFWDGTVISSVTLGNKVGPFGPAPTFNNSNSSFVRTAPAISARGTGPSLTISAWFWLQSDGTYNVLCEQFHGDGNTNPWRDAQLVLSGGLGIYYSAYNVNGSRVSTATIGDLIRLQTWQHAAVTYDDVSGSLKTYINGSLEATSTLAPAGALNWGPPNGLTNVGQGLNGSICEVRMANTVRSAEYIQKMYYAGMAGLYKRGVI